MKSKKTKDADLENKRTIWLQIGIIFSLAISLVAFEWFFADYDDASLSGYTVETIFEEEMINTFRNEEKKEKPKIEKPKPLEVMEIVENTEDIETDIDFSSEADEDLFVEVSLEPEPEAEETKHFVVVENMPEFPGGYPALIKEINRIIKYPERAKELGISGKVFVEFVVWKDGSIRDVKVARSIDPILDEEALRVVKLLPDWIPGKQRGKPVPVVYTIPVNFVLE